MKAAFSGSGSIKWIASAPARSISSREGASLRADVDDRPIVETGQERAQQSPDSGSCPYSIHADDRNRPVFAEVEDRLPDLGHSAPSGKPNQPVAPC